MKSYIFDFDGVIGDTFEAISSFYAKVTFKPLPQAQDKIRKVLMVNDNESLSQKFIKTIFSKPFENYIKSYSKPLLFQDRLNEIAMLKGPKAILTNNYSTICKNILGDKVELFDTIIGMEEVDSKLQGLEMILNKPEFEIDEVLFFTDSLGDVLEVSNRLPITQIYAVDWGFHSPEILRKKLPKSQIISDFQGF